MLNQTYLSQADVSEYCSSKGLKLSPKTLEKKRCTGGGPKFYKFGNRAVYRSDDVEAWISEQLGEPITHSGLPVSVSK